MTCSSKSFRFKRVVLKADSRNTHSHTTTATTRKQITVKTKQSSEVFNTRYLSTFPLGSKLRAVTSLQKATKN